MNPKFPTVKSNKNGRMKIISTTVAGAAGLIYGLAAGVLVYPEVPLALQAFIVAGVAAVGAGAGWLVGCAAASFPILRRKVRRDVQ